MPLRRLLTAVAFLATVLLSLTALSGVAAADTSLPRVSVISDSILTSVVWSNDPAQAVLHDGLDLQVDAGVCRRLNGESCEFNGTHVPTTLDVINSWYYELGSTVVIVDGYNDIPENFANDVELTLSTLRDANVQHVLWLDLHEVRPEYAAKNALLRAAAQHHPELQVLAWNGYSSAHLDWYQTDGIHLVPDGGLAIATFIRQAIAAALAPPPPPPPAPTLDVPANQALRAQVGVALDRQLRTGTATGLQWRTSSGVLQRAGLHLSASGEVTGTPARAGVFTLPLEVSDADGTTARVTVALTVARAQQ
jgi:Putative Ig domain